MDTMSPRNQARSCFSPLGAFTVMFGVRAATFGVLVAALACGPRSATPRSRPLPVERSNILLITIDTLRADHLSSYGYPRSTSPVLDRVAGEGIRYDQAIVQWPKTGPSFASLFTATYGKDNGMVRQVGVPLSCRFRMLAEVLAEQGYGTHAVVANGALAREFHFDQGFETYVETWKLPVEEDRDPNGATAVTNLAIGVLDRIDRSRPFFLWVHYLDPHFPYAAPLPWRDRFQGDAHYDESTKVHVFADKPTNQMYGIGRDQVLDGRDDLAFYVARYDAEIAYADEQIGRLLQEVAVRGLDRATLTVVTSDHGESLAEHHYHFDHGRFAF
jgi:arylsulfatase A-like enzyme